RGASRGRPPGAAPSNLPVAREPQGLPALQASRAAWEDSRGRAAGNGAVMRCAPLAIRWRHDDAALVLNTVCSAAVTHWDARCIWSSVFVNLAVASLLREPPDPELHLVQRAEQARQSLGDALAPYGIDAPPTASVTRALDVADIAEPHQIGLDGWDMGFTLKAMQVALWCVHRAADFEEALIAVVNAGGDTDTNGAVAGAVLGARFGLEAIPKRWRDRVARLRADRTAMEEWADRLLG
ncbi:MAG: ADP-ribosylglycohydrolase family protein, partial [Candidatus Tectomicrobia bacterium]|nr:ADP-ribosylglycohydrolase family protein [Candidatus Tectomicrobia bacterium]